jgi:hypothetical protein
VLTASLSQACSTTLGQWVTPLTCTAPVAGRSSVSSFAAPVRTYSCGCRVSDRLPTAAGIGHGLKRPRFILTRQRHAPPLRFAVCLRNQPRFAAASGS